MGRTSRKRRQKKKLKLTEIAKNKGDLLMHLKSWMLTNNCLSVCDFVSYNFAVTGRGLKTLKDIKANDILIEVPYQMLITTSTLHHSYISILFLNDGCYSAQCMLSVFLIYEVHLGVKSRWYHYIRSLPQTFTNPEFCTQNEKRILPAFIVDYMHQSHKLQNDFRSLVRSINDLRLDEKDKCPHCNKKLKKIITFNTYKWAYYVVNTRAVYMDTIVNQDNAINIKGSNNLALAPYLDLFNHDVHAAVRASTVSDKTGNKFYQLVTLRPFDKGSQVFINYGAHNNLKLCTDYGFFIPNNPLDEVNYEICDIEACMAISKSKMDFIISNNWHKNMAFIRQGLNYQATSVLFVLSTKVQKEFWSAKIYGGMFTAKDLFDVHNIGKKVLTLQRNKFVNSLSNMKNLKCYSPSFSVAIGLIQEYIMLLNESFDNLNVPFPLK